MLKLLKHVKPAKVNKENMVINWPEIFWDSTKPSWPLVAVNGEVKSLDVYGYVSPHEAMPDDQMVEVINNPSC